MSIAWSRVTRAGGACGEAGGAACAATCDGRSSPKTPRMTRGPEARAPNLNFLCIVSLLQKAVEALDRLSEAQEKRDAQENRISCSQVRRTPVVGGACETLSGGRSARRSLRKIRAGFQERFLRQRNGSHGLEQGHRRRDNDGRRSLMRQVAIGAARIIGRAVAIEVRDDNCGEDHQRDERHGDSEDAESPAHSVSGQARRMTNPLNNNWMWDVRKALPVTGGGECNTEKPSAGRMLDRGYAESGRTGFSLSGLDLWMTPAETRQAEACPTRSASGLVRESPGIARRARAARHPGGRCPAGRSAVRRQSPWPRARRRAPSPRSAWLRRRRSFCRPHSGPASGRRLHPDRRRGCSSDRKFPLLRDSTLRSLPCWTRLFWSVPARVASGTDFSLLGSIT